MKAYKKCYACVFLYIYLPVDIFVSLLCLKMFISITLLCVLIKKTSAANQRIKFNWFAYLPYIFFAFTTTIQSQHDTTASRHVTLHFLLHSTREEIFPLTHCKILKFYSKQNHIFPSTFEVIFCIIEIGGLRVLVQRGAFRSYVLLLQFVMNGPRSVGGGWF